MKGLVRNNVYAVCANAKVFSIFLLILGVCAVAVPSQSFQIGYVMIGMVGFSVNAIAVAKNEYASKWGRYKLTLPVRRADIIRSLFVNQLIWLAVGTVFAAAGIGLSWMIYGCLFDQPVDIVTMFALGVSISLFAGAFFFPLFCIGGAERSEVFLVIALLGAVGIDSVIVSILNEYLEPGMGTILLGAAVLAGGALLVFALSCQLAVAVFRRKEY